LEDLFDDLALHTNLVAQRMDSTSLLLDGPGVFVSAEGSRKIDYGSCTFRIWAESIARLDAVRATLLAIVGEQLVRREMFTIDWHFSTGRMGLSSASFDEVADPEPYDEAYPTLLEPVAAFIARYLASRETVLILQGPPGTGKTRLVRAILAAMSARKEDSAKVLYTADKRALESDEIFVDFITGSHDAFVIEDADHLLMARANGNVDLHRFLAIADGVVRAQGRKIIFTTNLPNVGDIDEALVRPGRCFATVRTRALLRSEAASLLARLDGARSPQDQTATEIALPPDVRSITLAALYRMVDTRQ
jgi:ATPase family associated with various cellular activities (AAA)